jgi:hypothetical protein
MSSHECYLQGTIHLRTGISQEQLEGALMPLLEREDTSLEDMIDGGEIEFADAMTVNILYQFWCAGGGYRIDELDETIQNLGALVSVPSYLTLVDNDTGDHDSVVTPYFIGETLQDQNRARLEYGLTEAMQWIEPALGKEAWKKIGAYITTFTPVGESLAA